MSSGSASDPSYRARVAYAASSLAKHAGSRPRATDPTPTTGDNRAMSGPGWRILIEDVDGKLRALCKIQTLADGGYSVLCPYHSAREGWMFKLPLGLGRRTATPTLVSLEDAIHYSASDRVKLSHHRDGLVQFSSEAKGRIKSGINPVTRQPRGIGVLSGPIDQGGVPSGPAFGVTAWGMKDYTEVQTPRKTDRIFRQVDLHDFLCTPATFNAYAVEGWLFGRAMWGLGVRGNADDTRIHIVGTTPATDGLVTREFRVIPLVNAESFLGLQVARTQTSFPSSSGFLLGGSRELSEEGNQIVATYPQPDELFPNTECLDYTPECK